MREKVFFPWIRENKNWVTKNLAYSGLLGLCFLLAVLIIWLLRIPGLHGAVNILRNAAVAFFACAGAIYIAIAVYAAAVLIHGWAKDLAYRRQL